MGTLIVLHIVLIWLYLIFEWIKNLTSLIARAVQQQHTDHSLFVLFVSNETHQSSTKNMLKRYIEGIDCHFWNWKIWIESFWTAKWTLSSTISFTPCLNWTVLSSSPSEMQPRIMNFALFLTLQWSSSR